MPLSWPLRVGLASATVTSMISVLVLAIVTHRNRQNKVIKASSPGLMYVTLFGAILLYSEVVAEAFAFSSPVCMLRPWLRHLGFIITYGGLLLKIWRVSIIMGMYRDRLYRTNDGELYRRIGLLTAVCLIYMAIWTLVDPLELEDFTVRSHCVVKWWTFVAMSAEILVLLWGGYLCYRARQAPALYNESKQVSYVLWNEASWTIFMIIFSIILDKSPDPDMLLITRFIRCQFTVTALLALIFVPKTGNGYVPGGTGKTFLVSVSSAPFICVFLVFDTFFFGAVSLGGLSKPSWHLILMVVRKTREVKGTLTDVYGNRRVHRLSLVINKQGEIRTIYCVPCGPLLYEGILDEPEPSSQEKRSVTRETEYTKAEVDKLIEMVSTLKHETEQYKVQLTRVLNLWKGTKMRLLNGCTPALVELDRQPVLHKIDGATCIHRKDSTWGSDTGEGDVLSDTDCMVPVSRTARTSTVTTYISSTPDTASVCTDKLEHVPIPPSLKGQTISVACKSCGASSLVDPEPQIGNNRRRFEQTNMVNTSIDEEDFPKIVHSHENTVDNKFSDEGMLAYWHQDLCQYHGQAKELKELTSLNQELRGDYACSVSTDRTSERDPSKLNFIMYI